MRKIEVFLNKIRGKVSQGLGKIGISDYIPLFNFVVFCLSFFYLMHFKYLSCFSIAFSDFKVSPSFFALILLPFSDIFYLFNSDIFSVINGLKNIKEQTNKIGLNNETD